MDGDGNYSIVANEIRTIMATITQEANPVAVAAATDNEEADDGDDKSSVLYNGPTIQARPLTVAACMSLARRQKTTITTTHVANHRIHKTSAALAITQWQVGSLQMPQQQQTVDMAEVTRAMCDDGTNKHGELIECCCGGGVVEAPLLPNAPTLSASTADCSSGSCSPDKSPIFSHFDNESVLLSDAHRSISSLYSHLCVTVSLSFEADPNLNCNGRIRGKTKNDLVL